MELQPEEIYSATIARAESDRCLVLISIRTFDNGFEHVHYYDGAFGSLLATVGATEDMFYAWVNGGHLGVLAEAEAKPGLWKYLR